MVAVNEKNGRIEKCMQEVYAALHRCSKSCNSREWWHVLNRPGAGRLCMSDVREVLSSHYSITLGPAKPKSCRIHQFHVPLWRPFLL